MENNLNRVVLVKDINPGTDDFGSPDSSYPSNLTEVNGKLYFTAKDRENGRELWVSDGTTEGTQLVADINSGTGDYGSYGYSSNPNNFTEFNGKAYFTANDGENGRELWVSDGTTEGTQLVADIRPDTGYFGYSSYPYNLTEFNSRLYFTANDGVNGNELWVTDGTTEGTQLVADIRSDVNRYGYGAGSNPDNLTEFDGKLYFTANDGANGKELWVTDGTTEDTQLLADINSTTNYYPGVDGASSYAENFTEFNNKLYFTANDGENGKELWVTDGTTEGTQLLADINSGGGESYRSGSYADNFTVVGDKLFFTADDGANGRELWVSDGTTEGTQLLVDINFSSSGYGSYPFNLTEFQDKLYFTADDEEYGRELWVSDGTTEGTQLLVDINSSSYGYGSYPSNLTEFQDKLYFIANDGENGRELWVSDGTTEGTQLLVDVNPNTRDLSYIYSSYPSNLTEFNDKLYFTANDGETGNELWVSDGTAEGTQLLIDIRPGTSGYYSGSYTSDFTEFNGKLYFAANDGENGRELWVSDGTAEGTQLLVDIRPVTSNYSYNYGSSPSNLTEFNDKLYFTANDGENGDELWVSDGTAEGTQLLVDINSGTSDYGYNYGSSPSNLTEFNDKLYFTANDGENGRELWVSDGTAEGTQLLVDIRPGTSGYGSSSYPSELTEFNDKLYFTANDGENGDELWVSDGTAEGTQLLVDINSGTSDYGYNYGSSPSNLTEFNDKLYFTANDGETGRELWVSDGTAEGTQLLVDIRPGTSNYGYNYSSYPENFTEFNGKLYFTANDGETGRELWVTDGTTEGTQLLIDIRPGTNNYGDASSSNVSDLTVVGDRLYFSADDGENGRELWVSDGTAEGTQLLTDIRPGSDNASYPYSSSPYDLTVVGNELYFTADDGENGRELFKFVGEEPINTIIGTKFSDNLVGTDGADRIEGLSGRDTIDGGAGNDTLLGGNRRDLIDGGLGNDRLDGGKDKDTLNGGAGDDTLLGDRDRDKLNGGLGDDSLDGGKGRDTLNGGAGDDLLTGGKGKDLFILKSGAGEDTIADFELGQDRLRLAGGLEFKDLTLSGNTIKAGDELLATLNGIETEDLTKRDFIDI